MIVSFTAETPAEIKKKMHDFLKIFAVDETVDPRQMTLEPQTDGALAVATSPVAPVAVVETQEVETAPKKRGRKPKDVEIAPAPKAAVAPDETVEITKDRVVTALKYLNDKKGLEAARNLLSKFDCGRVSELRPDQYGDFFHECVELANEN